MSMFGWGFDKPVEAPSNVVWRKVRKLRCSETKSPFKEVFIVGERAWFAVRFDLGEVFLKGSPPAYR
jgi:hypothetical protein